MTRLARLLIGLAAVGLLATGCSTGSDAVNQQNGGENRYVAGNGDSQVFAAKDRKSPPTVRGELLSGKHFDLASLRGHVVVVNFWASWCNPCAAEAPDMERVAKQTKAQGVEFLGVNVHDQRDLAKAFVTGRGMSYPSLYDPASRVALAFRATSPNTIPATLIIDKQGRVAVVWRKAVLGSDLSALIQRVIRGN